MTNYAGISFVAALIVLIVCACVAVAKDDAQRKRKEWWR